MQLKVCINGGIGDLIHSHAMLETEKRRYDEVVVAVDEIGLMTMRNIGHIGFARRLTDLLFSSAPYRVERSEQPVFERFGDTPQILAARGVRVALPDLRDVLPIDSVGVVPGYVAVHSKVRGWHRDNYEQIRRRFLDTLRRISASRPLVVIGEKVLSETPESRLHDGKMYSIYEDIMNATAGGVVVDSTFDEYGERPASWDQFRSDCTTMAHADAVVALGSGGNVSMAMACARSFTALIADTEMESYFRLLPATSRVVCRTTPAEYFRRLEACC